MVKITTTPPELLSTIAEAATLGDVLQLRLVCKHFSETLTAIAFRHIVIDTRGLSAQEGCRIDALKTLAEVEERHPVRYMARKLEVRSFQLNRDLNIEALNCFTTVCRNLTRVESLVWSWGSLDSYRSVSLKDSTPIVQALQPMIPSLREVELLAFRDDQIPLLNGLSLLTRLTIKPHSFTPEEVTDPVWKLVTGTIGRSSDTLQDLSLSIQPEGDEKSRPSIQDVLSNGCESPSLPKLRSLSLNAALAMLSKTKTLPQISSLQSLSLRLGDIGWPRGDNNLFIALRQSGILLQQVISPASAPLFDYLASYEGILREVQIEGSWELISETSEALMGQASRFFQDVIPKHRSSLRKIEIVTSYDDGWAFGDSNLNMFIDPLPALEWLEIAILVTGENNHLKTFLDRILTPSRFPLLRRIDLFVTVEPGTMCGVRTCGRYAISLRARSFKETMEKLRNYSFAFDGADAGLVRDLNPPRLYVRDHGFGPCVSGGSLHFEPLGTDWDFLNATVDGGYINW